MTSAPIQTGLLAFGLSGRVFQAPFVAAHPGFALRGIVERSQKAAQDFYPGIISYESVEALLQDETVELVIVNTPGNTHGELARQALQAGKHVLIEKPLAITSADVRELYALGRRVNRHVLAYQNRRWDSDFLSVASVIESGQLGQLIEVTFRFDRYKQALHTKLFKETAATPGSGLLYDLGPHLIDQAISLFGQPREVRKTVGHFRAGTQVDDYFQLQLLYPHGPLVTLASGLLIAGPLPSYVVHGTRGSFVKPRTDVQEAQLQAGLSPLASAYGQEPAEAAGRLTLADAQNRKTTTLVPAPKGDYMHLFEAVYRTIRQGASYPIREEQLLWQLQLLEHAGGVWQLRA